MMMRVINHADDVIDEFALIFYAQCAYIFTRLKSSSSNIAILLNWC